MERLLDQGCLWVMKFMQFVLLDKFKMRIIGICELG